MKAKDILWTIFYTVCACGGTLLCCFAETIKSKLFDCLPMGIMLMVVGFLCFTFDFIIYIVDKIMENKNMKK